MPIHIDPNWEYYTPNPELEELLHYDSDPLDQIYGGKENKCDVSFIFAVDSRKTPARIEKKCPDCKKLFFSQREDKKYCSKECWNRNRRGRGGRKRVLPESIPCKVCGTSFRPRQSSHRCCSKVCGSRQGGRGRSPSPSPQRLALFKKMYETGHSMKTIQRVLNIKSTRTIMLWRRRLSIPSRRKAS